MYLTPINVTAANVELTEFGTRLLVSAVIMSM